MITFYATGALVIKSDPPGRKIYPVPLLFITQLRQLLRS